MNDSLKPKAEEVLASLINKNKSLRALVNADDLEENVRKFCGAIDLSVLESEWVSLRQRRLQFGLTSEILDKLEEDVLVTDILKAIEGVPEEDYLHVLIPLFGTPEAKRNLFQEENKEIIWFTDMVKKLGFWYSVLRFLGAPLPSTLSEIISMFSDK